MTDAAKQFEIALERNAARRRESLARIKALEAKMQALTDDELRAKTDELRKKAADEHNDR